MNIERIKREALMAADIPDDCSCDYATDTGASYCAGCIARAYQEELVELAAKRVALLAAAKLAVEALYWLLNPPTGPSPDDAIWYCKIGGGTGPLGTGGDYPMRHAVDAAFREVTGHESSFIFSGWGHALTEPERAVVENREPSAEYEREWHAARAALSALRPLVSK